MKAQEILLLQHDVKPVVRQGFYPHELQKIKTYCNDNNLFYSLSNFKVLLVDNTQYSNKGMRISENDPRPGMFFMYISKDETKAHLAKYFEMLNNHEDLGKTLGYPECCTTYFKQNFSSQNSNPEHAPTNPYTNLTKRQNDAAIISHFPCSSECQQSINLAKSSVDVLMKIDKEHTYNLLDSLQI